MQCNNMQRNIHSSTSTAKSNRTNLILNVATMDLFNRFCGVVTVIIFGIAPLITTLKVSQRNQLSQRPMSMPVNAMSSAGVRALSIDCIVLLLFHSRFFPTPSFFLRYLWRMSFQFQHEHEPWARGMPIPPYHLHGAATKQAAFAMMLTFPSVPPIPPDPIYTLNQPWQCSHFQQSILGH